MIRNTTGAINHISKENLCGLSTNQRTMAIIMLSKNYQIRNFTCYYPVARTEGVVSVYAFYLQFPGFLLYQKLALKMLRTILSFCKPSFVGSLFGLGSRFFPINVHHNSEQISIFPTSFTNFTPSFLNFLLVLLFIKKFTHTTNY